MSSEDSGKKAEWPATDDLFPAMICDGVHPACLAIEALQAECTLRTQRRSGPGGQHRNKTSSGVFLEHLPTGHIGEATERRSQADNRGIAVDRLRLKLAVVARSPVGERGLKADRQATEDLARHVEVRQKFAGGKLKISLKNSDFAAVLAILMNDLWMAGGQPSLVTTSWKVSTSSITRLLKQYMPALAMVNQYRTHHGRSSLR